MPAVREYAGDRGGRIWKASKARVRRVHPQRPASCRTRAIARGQGPGQGAHATSRSSSGVRFQENIDEWEDHILVDPEELDGLPPSFAESLDTDEATGKLKVTLAYPHLIPFVENAKRRDLREELSFKFNTQAVEANRKILEEARDLRQQIAERVRGAQLGASSSRGEDGQGSGEGRGVLRRSATAADQARRGRSRRHGRAAQDRRGESADPDMGLALLRHATASHGLRRRSLRGGRVFPARLGPGGMFDLVQETFGLDFREVPDAEVWHPDVRLFAIHDASSGEELSLISTSISSLDEGKYGHAAEFPLILSRRLEDGSYQNPVCAMVANFTKPTASAPSLLQHGEVETLFHEFGHVLHQNLGRHRACPIRRHQRGEGLRGGADARSCSTGCGEPTSSAVLPATTRRATRSPTGLVDQLVAARQLNVAVQQLRQLQFGVVGPNDARLGSEIDFDVVLREGAKVGSHTASMRALSPWPRSASDGRL